MASVFNRLTENSYIGLGDGSVFCYDRMQRLVPDSTGVYSPRHDPAFYGWALNNVTRWLGNVPITVAAHVFMVSKCAEEIAKQRDHERSESLVLSAAYFGLHHDDHEAVFSDVPRPVKRMYPAIKEAESVVENVFYEENAALFPIKLSAIQRAAVQEIVREADLEVNMWEGLKYLPLYATNFKSRFTAYELASFHPAPYDGGDSYIWRHTELIALAQTQVASNLRRKEHAA